MSKEINETENEIFDIRLIVSKNNKGLYDYTFMNGKNNNGFSFGRDFLSKYYVERQIIETIEELLEVHK